MSRFVNTVTHVVVSVDDSKDGRFASGSWEPADSVDQPEGYAAMKVADLKAEIAKRNEGRDEADLLSTEGKKADLVTVLEADDASTSGD